MSKLSLTLAFLLCTGPAFAADNGTSASDSVEHGLESVKEGTKEAARSVSAAAESATKSASETAQKASQTAAEGAQKVSRTIKAATCPIVGDRRTKFYYAADSKSYAQMLDGQKFFEDDDRACFRTEDAARAEGYSRNAN